jgi:hypothetical protein
MRTHLHGLAIKYSSFVLNAKYTVHLAQTIASKTERLLHILYMILHHYTIRTGISR